MSPRNRLDYSIWRDTTPEEWADWRWQLRKRVTNLAQLREVLSVTADEANALRQSDGLFRFALTPHYLTLIDPDNPDCPIRRQAIPQTAEFYVAPYEAEDPLAEDAHSPTPGLVHRYPDRVLLLITHECGLYCRYCTRRRLVGDQQPVSTAMLETAFRYIRDTPTIRDVLISGGDPLVVPDERLRFVLASLRSIPHVEVIRIGSRVPVAMPQRITDDLVSILRAYRPVWFSTHFNHPQELAHPDAAAAMDRLADAGIPTLNQSVLLAGVNDCPVVMKNLVTGLVRVRCRPYYLYLCDTSEGLSHFRTSLARGLAIIEALRGHTTGFAVPTLVVDAPGGGGKVPVSPNYLVSQNDGRAVLRNYEGKLFTYYEGLPTPSAGAAACSLCGTRHHAAGPGGSLWGRRDPVGSRPAATSLPVISSADVSLSGDAPGDAP